MMPVGVYKTNIDDSIKADTIIAEIRRLLPESDPSIDLDDCDKVLRIETPAPELNESEIKALMKSYGYKIEPLP